MMTDHDWYELKMLPPSVNNNPFHEYVRTDGSLTDKGVAMQKFCITMLDHAAGVSRKRREVR